MGRGDRAIRTVPSAFLPDAEGIVNSRGTLRASPMTSRDRAHDPGVPLRAQPPAALVRALTVLVLSAAGCSRGDGVVGAPIPSPDGGEIWAVGFADSSWIAVGPGGTYTSFDLARAWKRVGPGPAASLSTPPGPLGMPVIQGRLFLNLDGGVFRSDDRGASWETVFRDGAEVFALAGRLHALRSGRLIASRDGGRTWPDTVRAHAAGGPKRLFAGTAEVLAAGGSFAYVSDGRTAWRTRDGGASWEDSLPGVLGPDPRRSPPGQPPAGPSIHVRHALLGDTLYALVSAGELFRSRDHGSTWQRVPGPVNVSRPGGVRLFAAGGALWASGPDGTCRFRPGSAHCDTVAGPGEVHGIAAERALIAAGPDGIWRADGRGGWIHASAGIPAAVNAVAALRHASFATANRGIFRSVDSLRTWTPGRRFVSAVHSLWTDGEQVFAITADSLVTCDRALVGCGTRPISVTGADAPGGVRVEPGRVHHENGVLHLAVMLLATRQGAVLRSDDLGRTWRIAAFARTPFIKRVWVREGSIFALTDAGIAVARGRGDTLNTVARFPVSDENATMARAGRRILVGTGGTLYGFTEEGDGIRGDGPGRAFAHPIRGIWISRQRPKEVVVATDSALLWSNDGGASFQPGGVEGVPLVDPGGIHELGDGTVLAAGANGLYRLRMDIPSAAPGALGRWVRGHWKTVLSVLAVVAGMLLLVRNALRRGNITRAYGPLGMLARKVPTWLNLKTHFLLYDRFLRQQIEGTDAAHPVFALPVKGPDGEPDLVTPDALIDALAASTVPLRPVLLTGGGGAGKSTVLRQIVRRYLEGRLPDSWRSLRPLIVEAGDYTGSFAQALATALRERYAVEVDEQNVTRMVATEPFLVLFDGASEIDAEERDQAYADLLRAAASQDFADCRIVIAARPVPGPSTLPEFRLLPLTIAQVRSDSLARYGLDDEQRKRVERQLERLGSQAITPLLLRLAVTAAATGAASASEADLYERYFRTLLGVEGEGADVQWRGWTLILSSLAGATLIRQGRRGIGLPLERAARVLREAEVEGENLMANLKGTYRIKRIQTAADILDRLAAASILVHDKGVQWRFAHDRYEEYFAAVYLLRSVQADPRWHEVKGWMKEERAGELVDVLRFAVQMDVQGRLRNARPIHLPAAWRNVLEGAGAGP